MKAEQVIPVRSSGWKPRVFAGMAGLSPGLRDVIRDEGSLTDILEALCGKDFNVRVLSQSLSRPALDECALLEIDNRRWALVREVLLLAGDSPLVYARSVLPLDTLTGRHRRLRQLGRTPLGRVLFSDPSMTRGDMQFAQFRFALGGAKFGDHVIWGRRSVFYLAGKPLLVNEIFLPHLDSLCQVGVTGK